jgi:hypothetical protein
MAFNGSGTFARIYNWVTDQNNSVDITASRFDTEMDGMATGISNAICRDGQSTISANIPFNNKKITALGDATAATDALNRQSGDARFEAIGKAYAINTQIANYTLVLGDAGKIVEMNVASSNTLTIPPNSSVAFDTTTRIDLCSVGIGQTTIVAGVGVTVHSVNGRLALTGQYSGGTLYKRGTDEWVLMGDLS